jgi:putative spermidine/putrescine transport system ATP-binding protein
MRDAGSELVIANVTRRFGGVTAVDAVSLSIAPGEFFTLLGPSGSGKTTLLQLLAGFQEADDGEIHLDGRPMCGVPPFRRDIGVVFQSYALFPNMTVFENVAFPLRVRKCTKADVRERVKRALEIVELDGLERRRPEQLSGGQQQRVAFARAIVFEPRLLLMDEPLSALDAKLRRSMRAEIKALQRKLGITVVYVTHDQDEALAMSDRVAVMNKGRVEQVDAPATLYEEPNSRFVARFLGDANLIEATVISQDASRVTETSFGQYRFRARAREVLTPGAAIVVATRPERIVVDPDERYENVASGTVVSSQYGGDHVLLHVEIGGTTIAAKRAVGLGPAPEVGRSIRIGWSSECASALAR